MDPRVDDMLNIAFLDPVGWDYDISTPYDRPLGGSQSALAYLATELARRRSRVTLIGGTSRPGRIMGVECVSVMDIPAEHLAQSFDGLIVLNGPSDICLNLRPHLDAGTPLVLWTQHAADQKAMQALESPEVQKGWDAIVCVSDWHRATMIAHYGLEPSRVFVLRNAIAPFFEGLFSSAQELEQTKGSRLTLSYTSTPFRGLDVLIALFPEARRAHPDARLDIYSSMKVYQQDELNDVHAPLYDRCRDTPGVRYVGAVSQWQLAEELKAASVLAYPNTFPETSCIAVMEALAAGLAVVTTDLGALPETTMGLADLVAPADDTRDLEDYAARFLDRLKEVLGARAADPSGFAEARFAQVETINAQYTWRRRAQEWEGALRDWKQVRSLRP